MMCCQHQDMLFEGPLIRAIHFYAKMVSRLRQKKTATAITVVRYVNSSDMSDTPTCRRNAAQ